MPYGRASHMLSFLGALIVPSGLLWRRISNTLGRKKASFLSYPVIRLSCFILATSKSALSVYASAFLRSVCPHYLRLLPGNLLRAFLMPAFVSLLGVLISSFLKNQKRGRYSLNLHLESFMRASQILALSKIRRGSKSISFISGLLPTKSGILKRKSSITLAAAHLFLAQKSGLISTGPQSLVRRPLCVWAKS